MKVTVSELRPKLTTILAMVAKGETVDIEQRGKIVAQLKPYSPPQVPVHHIRKQMDNYRYATGLEAEKRIQKAKDELLGKINRKSRG
jgi:antitoxin (DNA-binding transcriptional repressor) of toxin-antitoxin stability system